jgi:hypothetical protein
MRLSMPHLAHLVIPFSGAMKMAFKLWVQPFFFPWKHSPFFLHSHGGRHRPLPDG